MLKVLLLAAGLLSGEAGQVPQLCEPGQRGCSVREWRRHHAAAAYDPRLGESYNSVLNNEEDAPEAHEQAPVEDLAARFAAEMFISDLQVCLAKGGRWSWSPLIQDYVKHHDINQSGKEGKTPLIIAVEMTANMDVLGLILAMGAQVGIQDNYGRTALDYARRARYYPGAAEMLERALMRESGN
jgi:Ankyrin repeats (many copies)